MTHTQLKQLLCSGLTTEQIGAVLDVFEPERAQEEAPAPVQEEAPAPVPEEAPAAAQPETQAPSLSDVLRELAALKSAVQAANRAGAQQPPPAEEENPFASLI